MRMRIWIITKDKTVKSKEGLLYLLCIYSLGFIHIILLNIINTAVFLKLFYGIFYSVLKGNA